MPSMLRRTLACAAAAYFLVTPASARTFVYVSNYVDGTIGIYAMNQDTGSLSPMRIVPAGKVVMPIAASIDKRHLYAVVRSEPTRVLTYDIDPETGGLTKVAEAALPASMSNVATDRSGRFLLTTSYGANLVAVSPIDADGRVTQGPIQVVPTGENAHSLQTDRANRFAFATNLGSDQIMQFRFDAVTGRLSANDPPVYKTPAGDGPRHFVFSSDDRSLYVISEMGGTVAQLSIDPEKGTLALVASASIVAPGEGLLHGARQAPISEKSLESSPQVATPTEKPTIFAADIHIMPNGRFLYTSERTDSRIALLAVDPTTGKPAFVTSVVTVKQPRGFAIDPSGAFLVAAAEQADEVVVYRIGASTGHLAELGRYPGGKGGNWVEIVDFP